MKGAPASSPWLARHELTVAWREWSSMMTAGHRRRLSTVVIAMVVFSAILHLPAYVMVGQFATPDLIPDKAALFTISGALLLFFCLMLSQAMEQVTRAFYSRNDLDLILSSPVPARRVFAVRILAIALSTTMMAVFLAGPFINVLAFDGGARWLAGYGVAAAFGGIAAALAVAMTVGLFRTLGPRRTRLVAQVVAAVIGAATVIGIQVAAILSYGTLARPGALVSDAVLAGAPDADSAVWLAARAITGDLSSLLTIFAVGLVLLGGAVVIFSGRFGEHAVAAASVAGTGHKRQRVRAFVRRSAAAALRRKEWALLRRDPWLASQTLTQLLYLLPPALLLSRNFGTAAGSVTMIVLVLVTVSGQLAGGLAWLTISGEDAPDLVASAPVAPGAVQRAKVEAVMGAIALLFGPLLIVVAIISPSGAYIAGAGVALATASSIRIQLWFRSQAQRRNFRRRHTSSRIATFAEAFSSFAWAGAAGLAASGAWHAIIAAIFALLVLAGTWAISPRKATA